MIGDDSMASRRPSSPISTGQVLTFRQASAAGLYSGGSSRDRNTPGRPRGGCGRRPARAAGRCSGRPRPCARRWRSPPPAAAGPGRRAPSRRSADSRTAPRTGQRRRTVRPASLPAAGVDRLDPAAAGALERRHQLAREQPGQQGLDRRLVLGGLVPGDQLGAVDRQGQDLVEGAGVEVDDLDGLGLHVQEPDHDPDGGGVLRRAGTRSGSTTAPRRRPRSSGRASGRRTASGPGSWPPRPGRVQQVALVEDGVGHLAGQLEGGEGGVAHGFASRPP